MILMLMLLTNKIMFLIVILGIYGIMIKTDAKEIVVILLMLAYLTRMTSPNAPVSNLSSGAPLAITVNLTVKI